MVNLSVQSFYIEIIDKSRIFNNISSIETWKLELKEKKKDYDMFTAYGLNTIPLNIDIVIKNNFIIYFYDLRYLSNLSYDKTKISILGVVVPNLFTLNSYIKLLSNDDKQMMLSLIKDPDFLDIIKPFILFTPGVITKFADKQIIKINSLNFSSPTINKDIIVIFKKMITNDINLPLQKSFLKKYLFLIIILIILIIILIFYFTFIKKKSSFGKRRR